MDHGASKLTPPRSGILMQIDACILKKIKEKREKKKKKERKNTHTQTHYDGLGYFLRVLNVYIVHVENRKQLGRIYPLISLFKKNMEMLDVMVFDNTNEMKSCYGGESKLKGGSLKSSLCRLSLWSLQFITFGNKGMR